MVVFPASLSANSFTLWAIKLTVFLTYTHCDVQTDVYVEKKKIKGGGGGAGGVKNNSFPLSKFDRPN